MTKREIVSLFVKLFAIYCIIQVFFVVPQLFIHLANYTASLLKSAGYFVVMLLWLVFLLLVVCKSDKIAKWLYPNDAPGGQLTVLGTADLQRLGYHFIGLVLIVRGLPMLVHVLYQYISLSTQPVEHRYPQYLTSQLISLGLQLAIGLYLFLYPRGLANLWAKIQGKPWPKDDNYDI